VKGLAAPVSGVLLVYPRHVLHCIEAPLPAMRALVALMMRHQTSGDLASVRSLLCTDARKKFFAAYITETLQLASSQVAIRKM
jgi:hypothetical protein